MEVEAVDEGVIEALLIEAGTEGVKVNSLIAQLSGEGAASPSAPEPTEAPKAEPRAASPSPAVQTVLADPDLPEGTTFIKQTVRDALRDWCPR
jgi:pyruvate dehydrogenase E1 component beta subunit